MKDDVEILASSSLAAADLAEIESQLGEWGLHSRTSRMPPRRGVAEFGWLVLLTVPAEIVVRSMLERLGNEAYQGLRGLVERILARYRQPDDRPQPSGSSVVVESATSGARFSLEADLPLDAYRQLFDELTQRSATDGLRIFDRRNRRWELSASV